MNSKQGMHLYFTICPVRDEICGGESSLGEDFVGRDEISGEESSLGENFYPQG